MHYFTVHDARRTGVINAVDDGLLTFVRQRIISWEPSRRFEYGMEKCVLILSDTQLVTGLAFWLLGTRNSNAVFLPTIGKPWSSLHGSPAFLSFRQ
jgi:hypothetical protein